MKAWMSVVGALALALPAYAADTGMQNAQKQMNKDEAAAKSTMSKAASQQEMAFLSNLHKINQEEIQMGNLAKSNAQSPQVKSFADKMVTDHQSADSDLKNLVNDKQLSWDTIAAKTPSDMSKMPMMQKMQNLKGTQFDHQYLTDMVKGHEMALSKVKKAKTEFKSDDKLASFIDKLEPTLKAHLDEAKKLESSHAAARRGPVER